MISSHVLRLGLAACLQFSSLISLASNVEAASLIVTIEQIRSSHGEILVAIADSADSFKASTWVTSGRAPAQVGAQTLRFEGLRPGRYLVSSFHDENKNGFLDRSLFGIPAEGYGFSRNARGTFGPPDFGEAAIDVPEGISEITINVGY
jgi:uncharacterized protein (DUF2141 family)